ncbi:MAG: hypothetical protein ABIR28_01950 [Vicinamibacteria bacterium]
MPTNTGQKTEAELGAHLDPISKEPGSHPVGVGMGAAGGAASGLVMGAIAGPAGALVGAALGAVAGGIAGKVIAEGLNPSEEDAYWRENYASRPYVAQGVSYEAYRPAYKFGWESRNRYGNLGWEEAEEKLKRDWSTLEEQERLDLEWEKARSATRDAWDRMLPHRHEQK